MSEDRLLAELSVDRAWKNIETMVNQFPSRLAGSDACWQAAGFVDEQLRAVGVKSELMEYQGLVSFPEKATLEIISPEYRVYSCPRPGTQRLDRRKAGGGRVGGRRPRNLGKLRRDRHRRQDRHDRPVLLPAAPREAAHLRHPGRPGRNSIELGQ